jgi:branched-chain amino acid aminotransferase
VRLVAIDGAVVLPDAATISVYDRGFLYGDSVFEVLRTYAGVPFALEEHVARLARSAARVLIAMPIDERALAEEIARVVRSAGNEESYARIMLTRGEGPLGLDPDLASHPRRVVLVEPLAPPRREVYERGIAAVTVATKRAVDDTPAAGAKVSNYLSNLLAVREAKSRGAEEALIVDGRGEVVEGASSNVFLVRAGVLVTPPESAGILAGITRAHVLSAAKELGVPVELRALRVAELYAGDEVFITSSIREVVPVVRVDDRAVGAGVPGPTCRALYRAFRGHTALAALPMPWE